MTNKEVIQAWINGKPGKNGKRNLVTDGISVWSYRMLIGLTTEEGEKCMLDLSGKDCTNTTKRHCRSWSYRNIDQIKRILPVYNGNGYIYNTWLFPADVKARAIGAPSFLPYTEAIITMY